MGERLDNKRTSKPTSQEDMCTGEDLEYFYSCILTSPDLGLTKKQKDAVRLQMGTRQSKKDKEANKDNTIHLPDVDTDFFNKIQCPPAVAKKSKPQSLSTYADLTNVIPDDSTPDDSTPKRSHDDMDSARKVPKMSQDRLEPRKIHDDFPNDFPDKTLNMPSPSISEVNETETHVNFNTTTVDDSEDNSLQTEAIDPNKLPGDPTVETGDNSLQTEAIDLNKLARDIKGIQQYQKNMDAKLNEGSMANKKIIFLLEKLCEGQTDLDMTFKEELRRKEQVNIDDDKSAVGFFREGMIHDTASWQELEVMAEQEDPKLVKYIQATGGSFMIWWDRNLFKDSFLCSTLGTKGLIESKLYQLFCKLKPLPDQDHKEKSNVNREYSHEGMICKMISSARKRVLNRYNTSITRLTERFLPLAVKYYIDKDNMSSEERKEHKRLKREGLKLDEVRAVSFNEKVGVKVTSQHIHFKDKISDLVLQQVAEDEERNKKGSSGGNGGGVYGSGYNSGNGGNSGGGGGGNGASEN